MDDALSGPSANPTLQIQKDVLAGFNSPEDTQLPTYDAAALATLMLLPFDFVQACAAT